MPTMETLIDQMRRSQANVSFSDLVRVITSLGWVFSRQNGSHMIYARPGSPRINLQRDKGGQAKPYQVRQVLAAIDAIKGG